MVGGCWTPPPQIGLRLKIEFGLETAIENESLKIAIFSKTLVIQWWYCLEEKEHSDIETSSS